MSPYDYVFLTLARVPTPAPGPGAPAGCGCAGAAGGRRRDRRPVRAAARLGERRGGGAGALGRRARRLAAITSLEGVAEADGRAARADHPARRRGPAGAGRHLRAPLVRGRGRRRGRVRRRSPARAGRTSRRCSTRRSSASSAPSPPPPTARPASSRLLLITRYGDHGVWEASRDPTTEAMQIFPAASNSPAAPGPPAPGWWVRPGRDPSPLPREKRLTPAAASGVR